MDIEQNQTELAVDLQVADVRVKLQVGERRFTTMRQTLVAESSFFASLLSDRRNHVTEDCSYFVDADPTLFEHILRYLRRSVFPIFYDASRGHNYGLYIALLGEARFFGIPRLQHWLEQQEYTRAVHVKRKLSMVTGDVTNSFPDHVLTSESDTTMKFHPVYVTKSVYVCPRGILVHGGEPAACGKQCKEARGDEPLKYKDVTTLRIMMVKEKPVIIGDGNDQLSSVEEDNLISLDHTAS